MKVLLMMMMIARTRTREKTNEKDVVDASSV
jgi:hypothetical protein